MQKFKLVNFDERKVWFTSDTHFGHKNIIEYCKRPFLDEIEMDRKLIDNWNSVVKGNDLVFHLGDFGRNNPKEIFNKLKGKIHFILGNHDNKNKILPATNVTVYNSDILRVTINNQIIVLCHYPILSWDKQSIGAWHLYGHIHTVKGISYDKAPFQQSWDVGVDNNDFYPVSMVKIREIMESKKESSQILIKKLNDSTEQEQFDKENKETTLSNYKVE